MGRRHESSLVFHGIESLHHEGFILKMNRPHVGTTKESNGGSVMAFQRESQGRLLVRAIVVDDDHDDDNVDNGNDDDEIVMKTVVTFP